MTTREFTPPVLDRIIARMVETTVEVPASMGYSFDTLSTGDNDNLDAGTWRRTSDTVLQVALADSGGLSFPQDLALPLDDVEVSWDDADASSLSLTTLDVVRDPLSFAPLSLRLTFDGPLPAAGTALTIEIETGGTQEITQTVQRREWAARRDFVGRDLVATIAGSLVTIGDARFIVRAGPPWSTGDTFVDDAGVTRTVRGVAQIGRSRYLELLARSVG